MKDSWPCYAASSCLWHTPCHSVRGHSGT